MPAQREAVAPTVARVLTAVEPAGLEAEQVADLAVALSEALANAAIHGNGLRPGTRVAVTARVSPGSRAVIDVTDAGPGFDVSAVADPTDPTRLFESHGRGLFLMRRLVTHLEYNPTGNRVRLTIERRGRRRTDR